MSAYITNTDEFACKQCKQIYRVNKTVCHYPEILVITLKRHLQTTVQNNIPIFKKNDKRCFFPIEYKFGSALYSLKGISLHSGSTESGHYTAACYNDFYNKWYLFNDDNVDNVDIGSEQVGVNAYAFFYSKIDNVA